MSRNAQFNCVIPATARCAVCGAVKKQTNHWYMVNLDGRELAIMAYDQGMLEEGCPVVCGEACLLKMVSANLDVVYPPLTTKSEELGIAEGRNE